MTDTFRIRRATNEPAVAEGLADVLLDVVESGASVGFIALGRRCAFCSMNARAVSTMPGLDRKFSSSRTC